MKIGVDLRFLEKNDHYSNFIIKLLQAYTKDKKDYKFNIYLSLDFIHLDFGDNTKNIEANERPGSLSEQTSFLKLLNNDNNDLLIFFNYKKPIKYKKEYILFLANLAEFHYPSQKNIFRKYFDNYMLNINCKNAFKIVCFNRQVKSEINDKLNVAEQKIETLTPFFNKITVPKSDININIKAKYNINGDYILYSNGSGGHKNTDRLMEVFAKIENINLVFIDPSSIKDLQIRKQIIENSLQKRSYFLGDLELTEKYELYKNSLAIIFPSLYEVFPFSMEEAINFNTKILSSKLKSIEEIFQDKLIYFDQTNSFDIYEKIIETSKNKKIVNYSDVLKKYNIENSLKEFNKVF